VFYLVASSLAHVFGGQVLLISNDPGFGFSLAFDHLGELFVFSCSSFSFAQAVRVLVLTMHSSRGRLRIQG
jgi:hypothetical protein